jgi:hypothetical protein
MKKSVLPGGAGAVPGKSTTTTKAGTRSTLSKSRVPVVGSTTGGSLPRLTSRLPSKDPSVRAFVQANSRVTNMTALFHDEVDTQNISAALVKNARKSGALNLSGRNLQSGESRS